MRECGAVLLRQIHNPPREAAHDMKKRKNKRKKQRYRTAAAAVEVLCSTVYLRYGSLNAGIGLYEASCAVRRSSPMHMPRALRVPSTNAPSALQHYPENDRSLWNSQCRVGGMV